MRRLIISLLALLAACGPRLDDTEAERLLLLAVYDASKVRTDPYVRYYNASDAEQNFALYGNSDCIEGAGGEVPDYRFGAVAPGSYSAVFQVRSAAYFYAVNGTCYFPSPRETATFERGSYYAPNRYRCRSPYSSGASLICERE